MSGYSKSFTYSEIADFLSFVNGEPMDVLESATMADIVKFFQKVILREKVVGNKYKKYNSDYMDNYDLNIENYNLDDILSLFHIDYDFTQEDLAAAKKRALHTHPDKSGLGKEYFIFFQQAYKILHRIYYFRFRQNKKAHTRDTIEIADDQRVILERLKNKKTGEFNKWFNEMFEKVKIQDETDFGYDAWLRSDEDIHEMSRISLSQFDNEFDKVKQRCKTHAIVTSVGEIGGDSGYSLTRDKPQSFLQECLVN